MHSKGNFEFGVKSNINDPIQEEICEKLKSLKVSSDEEAELSVNNIMESPAYVMNSKMEKKVENYAIKVCQKAHSFYKQDYHRVRFIIKKLEKSYGGEWNCITGI